MSVYEYRCLQEESDPMELKLYVVVSFLTLVLGTEIGSSVTVVHALNQ